MSIYPRSAVFLSLIFISCSGTRPDRSYLIDQNVSCSNIISVAQPWMGTPYKYGGIDFNGVDCSGFVQNIFQQTVNIDLPRTVDLMYQHGTFVRGGELICGDLLFFKNIRGRSGVDHVGIYVGNNHFIHASTSQGVVISDLNAVYYISRFVSARRY